MATGDPRPNEWQMGWQCPCCKTIYSPFQLTCFHCPSMFSASIHVCPENDVSGDETGDSYGDSPDGHVTSLGGSNT